MMRWWRSHSVRVQLTLWYVAAMTIVLAVYAAAILAYVSRSASAALDQQLRGDFQFAAAMVEQTPQGGITWSSDEGIAEERPCLQVWSPEGQLLYRNDQAEQRPVPARDLINLPDDTIVTIPTADMPMRVLSRRGRIASKPVVIQVARSEGPMRQQIRDVVLILLLGLPLAVATAGLGGYTVASRPISSSGLWTGNRSPSLSAVIERARSAMRSTGLSARRARE